MTDSINDPMGLAIWDFHHQNPLHTLKVDLDVTDSDTFPIPYLFRTFEKMPKLEQMALALAKGKVADIGAGAGCHSIYLQENKFDVFAVEQSKLSCEVMRKRGIKNVLYEDFYNLKDKFDTIFMLMNGIGLVQKINHFPTFFNKLKSILNKDGKLIFDSSDLRYLYENEDGSIEIDLNSSYYGEVNYKLTYNDTTCTFPWLFVDFGVLSMYAEENGFKATLIKEGNHYDYLASLQLDE